MTARRRQNFAWLAAARVAAGAFGAPLAPSVLVVLRTMFSDSAKRTPSSGGGVARPLAEGPIKRIVECMRAFVDVEIARQPDLHASTNLDEATTRRIGWSADRL
jgi:hypothetical protein